jgi:hypothetical protein
MSMATADPPLKGVKEIGEIFLITEQSLALRLEYDYLLPKQLGAILASIEGIHRAIVLTAHDPVVAAVRLTLVEASTASPIKLKFGGWIPKVRVKDGDAELWLPAFTIPIVLAGGLIGGAAGLVIATDQSLESYDRLRKRLFPAAQTQVVTETVQPILTADQQKKAEDAYSLDRLVDPNDMVSHDLQYSLKRWHHETTAPNIIRVEVNGIEVRRRDDEEEDRPKRPVKV